jgi:2-desacetyl-2-hydroxyethyl bacteriochlorophyllide A dehydrogenase
MLPAAKDTSMKALYLEKPGEFRAADIPEPSAPAAGEALVRVHRVGICGTDVSCYLGKFPFFAYPRIPGHELGVEVLAVGPGVTNVKAGDRCSVEPYMHCGECHACKKGATNCCAKLKVIGVMCDGGLCERFVVRAAKLHPSKKLAFDQLALVETLAIGCHAVNRCSPQKDENVLIIGAGPIGLATIEFVRLTGARMIVMDVNEQRLAFCRERMGVAETVMAGEGVEEKLRAMTDGALPDIVIDATGNAKSMSAAFGMVAPTGKLVFVGITQGEVTFKHPTFHRPEGTLLCSRNALPGDFTRIISLIEEGKIDTGPWITHRTAMSELGANFPEYLKPETGVVKAVVEIA